MSKYFTIVLILALGYFVGVKFPGLAQRLGVA